MRLSDRSCNWMGTWSVEYLEETQDGKVCALRIVGSEAGEREGC